jgi:hypothetical protein
VFTGKDTGTYGEQSYTPGAHPVPSGVKYKAMDWHGLTDAPELMP